jgi:hypothetical protein
MAGKTRSSDRFVIDRGRQPSAGAFTGPPPFRHKPLETDHAKPHSLLVAVHQARREGPPLARYNLGSSPWRLLPAVATRRGPRRFLTVERDPPVKEINHLAGRQRGSNPPFRTCSSVEDDLRGQALLVRAAYTGEPQVPIKDRRSRAATPRKIGARL